MLNAGFSTQRKTQHNVIEVLNFLNVMLGINTLVMHSTHEYKRVGWNESSGKDKLSDFVEEYWHYDNISKKSEKQFINSYQKWAEKKGNHQSEAKAVNIYAMAKEGIPTLSSSTPSTKMLVLEAVQVDNTLKMILTQMQELARSLKEYPIVRDMGGVR